MANPLKIAVGLVKVVTGVVILAAGVEKRHEILVEGGKMIVSGVNEN